ncbi:hypothetical protein HU200_067714 [Digitaria exilis]|uniref:Uncharacterized protein n=1 Tax=Digitaria exilis TaxID=1010633 RepID=A0A834ZVV6_9POAL|nr:hypothetical protein HU200_067714 [Digitaria exilis]CAB3470199.1 unnamed protein product [Digitaria exilis]
MKRDGLHHGTVRISRNKLLRVAATSAAALEETTTAVVGATAMAPPEKKAPPTTKPTKAASKTTGKRRQRDKAKGAHKLHACDVALNHRLVSWRVVDAAAAGGSGSSRIPDYKGTSASSLLAYLAGGNSWHEEEDDDDGGSAPPVNGGLSDLYDLIVGRRADVATDIEVEEDNDAIEEQGKDADDVEEDGEEDEEDMGFCMVGITIAVEFSDGEGEDWVVVQEI